MNVGVSHACCASNRDDFRARNRYYMFKRYLRVRARTPKRQRADIVLCRYASEYCSVADTRSRATAVDVYDAFRDVRYPCATTAGLARISPRKRGRDDFVEFDLLLYSACRLGRVSYADATVSVENTYVPGYAYGRYVETARTRPYRAHGHTAILWRTYRETRTHRFSVCKPRVFAKIRCRQPP